jgi:SAM-dependent methyltransferase
MNVYQRPEYYEIAFGFRDLRKEVDFFEAAIRKFSVVEVRSVFELGAGTCPYLEEWHRRGYRYFGLDASPEMIGFSRRRAQELQADLTLFRRNMTRFAIGSRKFDLAYVLLGSLYVRTNSEFFNHLDCVAKVLRPGGLYVLDGVVRFNILAKHEERWTMKRYGIGVRTSYRPQLVDPIEQTCIEHVVLEVDDHSKKSRLESELERKLFFPQEFLLLIQTHKRFEFVGWFMDFELRKPRSLSGRPIVILRKR